MSDSATPGTVAHQAALSMGFPRQEYWSGLSFSSPGNLPDTGIKSGSPPLQADSLRLSHQGSLLAMTYSKSEAAEVLLIPPTPHPQQSCLSNPL